MPISLHSGKATPFLTALLVSLGVSLVVSFATARPASIDRSASRVTPDRISLAQPRAIDGDTFEATIPLWPDLTIRTKIRISGIDAPELRGRCAGERSKARNSREALQFLLESDVRLHSVSRDKFGGRFVAHGTLVDGSDLGQTLINGGFARRYAGGKRLGWC